MILEPDYTNKVITSTSCVVWDWVCLFLRIIAFWVMMPYNSVLRWQHFRRNLAPTTKLQGTTFQNTVIFIVTAVRTPNLTYIFNSEVFPYTLAYSDACKPPVHWVVFIAFSSVRNSLMEVNTDLWPTSTVCLNVSFMTRFRYLLRNKWIIYIHTHM
jgi:hypothetical protein